MVISFPIAAFVGMIGLFAAAHNATYFLIDLAAARAVQSVHLDCFDIVMRILGIPGYPPLVNLLVISIIGTLYFAGLRWEAVMEAFADVAEVNSDQDLIYGRTSVGNRHRATSALHDCVPRFCAQSAHRSRAAVLQLLGPQPETPPNGDNEIENDRLVSDNPSWRTYSWLVSMRQVLIWAN